MNYLIEECAEGTLSRRKATLSSRRRWEPDQKRIVVQNPRSAAKYVALRLLVVSSCLLFLAGIPASGQQLVQNGGFETGNFTNWTQSGNTNYTTVATNSLYAHSNAYGAQLGPSGSLGFISQFLSTTPGQSYLLSFWLDSPDGGTPNQFQVSWNGATIFNQTNIAAIGWTNLQFIVRATGKNTMLQFGFRDDPSYLGLDDNYVIPKVTTNAAVAIYGALQGGANYCAGEA